MAIRRDWKGPELIERIRTNARAAVKRSAIILQTEIKLQLNMGSSNRGSTPSIPPAPPHKDTGQLSQSIQVTLQDIFKPNPKAAVGPDLSRVPYARIHELGGVIKPVSAKMMAVPLGIEGRRAARDAGGSLRNLDLFLIRSRSGALLLMRKGARKAKALFVLKRSIKMPKRPYIAPASKLARPKILHEFTPEALLREI